MVRVLWGANLFYLYIEYYYSVDNKIMLKFLKSRPLSSLRSVRPSVWFLSSIQLNVHLPACAPFVCLFVCVSAPLSYLPKMLIELVPVRFLINLALTAIVTDTTMH